MEFKNYKLTSINEYLSVDQLQTYLKSSSSIGEMKYVFNKLETPDVTAVKTEFKKVFEKDPDGFYKAMNPDLRDALGINNADELIALVKDTSSELYDFIEVK